MRWPNKETIAYLKQHKKTLIRNTPQYSIQTTQVTAVNLIYLIDESEEDKDRRHNAKIRWHRWAILDLQAVPSDLPVAGNAFKWVTTSTSRWLQPKSNDRYLRKISRFSYTSISRTPIQRV